MALRTAEETMDLVRSITALIDEFETYFAGDFATSHADVVSETEVGDDVFENAAVRSALTNVENSLRSVRDSLNALAISAYPALARLAGSPTLTNAAMAIDWFHKYLVDNNISIKDRAFTKSAPGLSGAEGNGTVTHSVEDANSDTIDIGRVETLTLTCVQSAREGSPRGHETFRIKGAPADSTLPWAEPGSGDGNLLGYRYGGVPLDLQNVPQITNELRSRTGDPQSGNIVNNGNFAASRGPASLPGWVIATGDAVIFNEPDSINQLNSLRIEGEFEIRQRIEVRSNTAYGFGIKVMPSGTTVTGNIRARLIAGSTTLHTFSTALSGLTLDDVAVLADDPFVIPPTDEPVFLVLDWAGTGTGDPEITIDDVTLAPANLVNGRLVFIYDGTYNESGVPTGSWQFGDEITLATSGGTGGKVQQYFINRPSGRYVKSSNSPTANFGDPT
jgi:hypothetical protein